MITIQLLDKYNNEWFADIMNKIGNDLNTDTTQDLQIHFKKRLKETIELLKSQTNNVITASPYTIDFISEVIAKGLQYLPYHNVTPQGMYFLAQLRIEMEKEFDKYLWREMITEETI